MVKKNYLSDLPLIKYDLFHYQNYYFVKKNSTRFTFFKFLSTAVAPYNVVQSSSSKGDKNSLKMTTTIQPS